MQTLDHPRCVKRTEKSTSSPRAIEPSVANGATMQNAIVQWRSDNALCEHRAHEERHADSYQRNRGAMCQVSESLAQFVQVAVNGMSILQFRAKRFWPRHCDASLSNKQIAGDRHDISAEVE